MTKPTYCNFCEETTVKPSNTCQDCGRPVCLDCTCDTDAESGGRICQPCLAIREENMIRHINRVRNDILFFAHIFGDEATIEQMTR